jgi:hypothetical protein
VVVINVATGSAIGDSNQGTCAGDVYLTGGSLTIYTEYSGAGIGKTGRLIVTGGSLKAAMTSNAIGPGYGLGTVAPGIYVRDDSISIMATKLNGSLQPVSLLKFDTTLLSRSATTFTVSGAITYNGGLHSIDLESSTNTVESFREIVGTGDAYYDSNLYFYLPKAANQTLTVNNEAFTVSWDTDKQAFTVKNESGAYVNPGVNETTVPGTTTVEDDSAVTIVDEPVALGSDPTLVVISVETNGATVNTITAEVTAENVKAIAENGSSLEVRSDLGNVTLPNAAVKDLASKSGEKIDVKLAKNSADTYTLALTADDKAVTTVDGGIKAVIPSEDASPGTVAVLVHEDGTEEVIKKSYGKDGVVSVPLTGSATIKIVDNAKSFADVGSGAWYNDAVLFASSHELFKGTGGGKFSPDTSMTRGMLVTVLHRLENAPDASGELFADVDGGAYYAEAVIWASANDIVNGTGNGFSPNSDVTREQIVVMIYRYYVSIVGDGVLDVPDGDIASFPDADSVSDWAEDAVIWAVGIGLIQGRDSGLAPQGTATRAEVATILQRFVEQL